MSKQLEITLSDEWYDWVEGEATHRGQSESELFEDALTAFLAELQANVKRLEDEAFHRKRFSAALDAIFNDNARITRRTWRNSKIYCSAVAQMLCITGVDADGKPHPWSITESDFYSDDWEIVQ